MDRKDRRQNRTDFMVRLYEIVDASVGTFVSAFDVAEPIGIDPAEVKRLIEYLEEKEYIHIDDYQRGVIRITATGIDHVESLG
jgi:Mn-dependent DtxR family transcriptional regulator